MSDNIIKSESISIPPVDPLLEALKDVKLQKLNVEETLKQITKKENELKIELMIRDTGLTIGTEVSLRNKSGIISEYHSQYGSIYPVIKYFKKDGTLGERKHDLFSLDIKKLVILK